MQFLYILTLNPRYHNPENWDDEVNQTMDLHFTYLQTKFAEGVMKHVGRTDLDFGNEDLHGYAIFESGSEEAAHQIMNHDPAIAEGLMSGKLLPYKIIFP
jgi:uncharacterized protein YciI